MTLVDEHQRLRRQVVDQRRRRLARLPPRQVPRVVLDALAEAHLVQHLEVEPGPLLDPLRLDQLHLALEELDPLGELELDRLDRPERRRPRRDVVARRIHGEARHALHRPAGQRIEQHQAVDLVVEQGHPHRCLRVLRRENVDDVAADAERAAAEVELGALVLHRDQPRDDLALVRVLALAQVQDHAVVVDRVADAVDAGHGRDDHRVFALEQRLRRRQPHLLDVLVDARVLLDIEVARGDVGLGLVVVVVGDEVLDRVLGEELAELRIELRCQGLVRREDERGSSDARDDVRHRVGLARTGHAEQRLGGEPVAEPLGELVDRFRLVARRRERLVEAERALREREDLALLRLSGGGGGLGHARDGIGRHGSLQFSHSRAALRHRAALRTGRICSRPNSRPRT